MTSDRPVREGGVDVRGERPARRPGPDRQARRAVVLRLHGEQPRHHVLRPAADGRMEPLGGGARGAQLRRGHDGAATQQRHRSSVRKPSPA